MLRPAPRRATPRRVPTLADRLVMRLRPGSAPPLPTDSAFPPRPTQLALPFGDEPADATLHLLPSLFREARRVEAVLSYEQASLEQIIPDAAGASGGPRSRLILPGGIGLVLYDGPRDGLAFDWMHWSETGKPGPGGPACDATVRLDELARGPRAIRKLARRRCIIPLTRYSVPVRQADGWAHHWLSPQRGKVACAAGIWTSEKGRKPCFAMVTDGHGGTQGPLILAESDLLLWLRAPIKDLLAQLARPPAKSQD